MNGFHAGVPENPDENPDGKPEPRGDRTSGAKKTRTRSRNPGIAETRTDGFPLQDSGIPVENPGTPRKTESQEDGTRREPVPTPPPPQGDRHPEGRHDTIPGGFRNLPLKGEEKTPGKGKGGDTYEKVPYI